jgi:anti-sigma factor RsiW
MRPNADCRECLSKAQLYVDNELSASEAAAVLSHTKDCAECRKALASLETFSAGVKTGADYFDAPAALVARVKAMGAPKSVTRQPPVWMSWALPLSSAATLAVALLLYVSAPSPVDLLADEAVSAHVRALQEKHITDVASTDQHTVKPWFAGRIDFSPPVHDFAKQGYPLIGGRLDYVNHQTAAALIYHRNKHVINILITPTPDSDSSMTTLSRRGYNIVLWRKNHLAFEAVSDLNASELMELCRLVSDAP